MKVSYEGKKVMISRTAPGHWVAWLLVTAAGCLLMAVCLSVAVSGVVGMTSPRDLVLALLFAVGALLPGWVLWLSFFAFLPVRYELRPLATGGVEACWSLGLLRSRWQAFTLQPLIAVAPAYQRGHWGFFLRLRNANGRSFLLSSPTLGSDSREQARQDGSRVAAAIGTHLGIPVQPEGWDPIETCVIE